MDEDLLKSGVNETEVDRKEIMKLSNEIVTKIFVDRKNHYTIFKQFDQDKDGFVSYQDFADKVKQMQISAPTENLVSLAKFLDKEGKGYLDFKNFSERFNISLPALLNSQEE